MDRSSRKRVEGVFYRAIERAPSEWPDFLDQACGDDDELRRQVEALLEHHTRTGSLFSASRAVVEELLKNRLGPAVEGRTIGPYRIERELGSGGMGRVFLARREDLPKRVALKLVREPLASPDRVRRFRLEQRVLAGLEHPGIAQLLDAGVTEDGTPWFAMELVEGEPLTAYCDRNRLSVADRLRLMRDVCSALAYAHRRLVVHRDIKPSNIFVTADGRPKLLDFGVAKLLNSDDDVSLTRSGMRVFTPNYASPEQLAGEPVTTATDIYQLGVVLYELMAGRPPFELAAESPAEAERMVRTLDPLAPSSAITKSVDPLRANEIAERRSATLERLRHRLRGDIDTIVLEALHKRPEDRYPSVDALANDIDRFLAGRPVSARPPTLRYRLGKFVRRNRIAAVIAFLLFGYATTVTVGAARISRARDRAEREAATANRVSDFLVEVFTRADPADTVPGEATALELVNRGAAQLDAHLGDEPEMRAAMQEVLARVYHGFGREGEAEPLLRQALETRLELFGPASLEVASARHHLAQVLLATGDLAGADSLDRQALAVRRELLEPDDPRLWETMSDLGTVWQLQGDLEAADSILADVIGMVQVAHPDGHIRLGGYLNNLANVRFNAGDFAAGHALMEQALESDLRYLPADHPAIALRLDNLAYMALRAEAYEDALARAEEALAMYRRVYGQDHPDMPYAMTTIAAASAALGDIARADSMYAAALAMRIELSGPDHPILFLSYRDLGKHYLATGRPDEAEEYFVQAVRIALETRGEHHERYASALWNLGRAREALGDTDAADSLLRRGYALHSTLLGDDHPAVIDEREYLADFLRRSGHPLEASRLAASDNDSIS